MMLYFGFVRLLNEKQVSEDSFMDDTELAAIPLIQKSVHLPVSSSMPKSDLRIKTGFAFA